MTDRRTGLMGAFFSGALFLLSAQTAVAQFTEFRGGGFIADFNNCSGWNGVPQVYVRQRPAGAPGNDAHITRLSLFFDSYSYHVRLPPSTPVGQWVDAIAVANIGGGAGYQENPDVRPRYRRLATPAFTTGTDSELHLIFEIANFDYQQNCTVRGNMMMHRR